MTIKRVDTSKARAKLIASFWWAYLLGIIAVIGLVIGVVFLVKWWLKKKKNAVERKEKEKQVESNVELKEVKVVEDRKQKEKADSVKKEAKSQSKPRSTPKKKKNLKVSKPKHTLTPSKEEEAPKSFGTTSDIKAERAAVAAKRWEDNREYYEEASKYLKKEGSQGTVEELAKEVLHFAAHLYKTVSIGKPLYDELSYTFCFQNRRVSDEDEWKMYACSTAEGALICQKLMQLWVFSAKADKFLNEHGMKPKTTILVDDLRKMMKNTNVPGYIWARCLARSYQRLIPLDISDITVQIILLFSDKINQEDREIILRDIKIGFVDLVNKYGGHHVNALGFYPFPILYQIYINYDDKNHILPPETSKMPRVSAPDPIIEPPEKDIRGKPLWYNLPEDRIPQPDDASEVMYEVAMKKDKEEKQNLKKTEEEETSKLKEKIEEEKPKIEKKNDPKDDPLRDHDKEMREKLLKKKKQREGTILGSNEAIPRKKSATSPPKPTSDDGKEPGKLEKTVTEESKQ
uniref:Uncharacterized protein n=1 Tax=Panagrolaimus sp. JU765 TaxID=591449 RepID=A0AC34Q5M3_9BILA